MENLLPVGSDRNMRNSFGIPKTPPKTKIFVWLINKSALLTWSNLQTRGWSGPNTCCMCKKTGEDIKHLMLNCEFSVHLQQKYSTYFNMELDMIMGDNIWEKLSTRNSTTFINTIIMALCWHIWREQNNIIDYLQTYVTQQRCT